jgi:hypothetical protein
MAEFNFPEWRLGVEPPAADLPPPEYAEADAVREQQLNDQYLAGQRQILNLGENAYYRQQGEAAIHAAPPAFKALQQLKDDTLAQAGNDRQREALTKRLDWHHDEARHGISRHLFQQGQTWRQVVADGQVKTAEEEAAVNHNDPAKVDLFATGAYSTRLRSAGQPPESEAAQAMAAQARSSVYRRAIEAALAAGNSRSAIGLYERTKDRLTTSDAGPMQGQIKAVTQRETARDYVTGLELPTPGEPSTFFDAPKQLAEVEAAHQAATSQNEADWSHNADQRAINQHYIDVQFGQQKQEIAEAKAELDGAVGNWIATPRPDGRPQTDLPPPVLWAQLGPDEQQAVLAALKRNALGPEDGGGPEGEPTGTADPNIVLAADKEKEKKPPLPGGANRPRLGAPDDEPPPVKQIDPFAGRGVGGFRIPGGAPRAVPKAPVPGSSAIKPGGQPAGEARAFDQTTGEDAQTEAARIEARRRQQAEQLEKNKVKSREWEKETEADSVRQGLQVGTQITIQMPSATRFRADILTRDPVTGRMSCIECKASEKAPLSEQQEKGFSEWKHSPGTIMGKGKPGFEGGLEIPPLEVQIKRKP